MVTDSDAAELTDNPEEPTEPKDEESSDPDVEDEEDEEEEELTPEQLIAQEIEALQKYTKLELATLLVEERSTAGTLQELSDLKMEVDDSHRMEVGLPAQIAIWRSIASGQEVAAGDVYRIDVQPGTVRYQLRGDSQTYGIETTGGENSGVLVDPPPHEHEFNVRKDGAQPSCYCGKSE